jgi:16S rRNA (adenine1518-N6/adenine1519-N6)-dimethyltransferase
MLLREGETGAPPDLTDPRVVRRLLRQHNVRPNKNFGQHLLVDREALDVIVDAAELTPDDAVLEVGAGMGVLTVPLAERVGRLVTVEMERGILPLLRETTARFANVEIVEGDLLLIRPSELFGERPYKVVANLPYYITAAALRHFLEADHRPERIVVMVQKEVAARLTARPGDMSMLGLSVQYYGRPQLVRVVKAESFLPPPQVDSAIVRVDVYPAERLDAATQTVLFGIAHAGFAERRKQLHNTLARNMRVPRERLERWLAEAGIEPSRRAETLSVEEWMQLAQVARADGYAGL